MNKRKDLGNFEVSRSAKRLTSMSNDNDNSESLGSEDSSSDDPVVLTPKGPVGPAARNNRYRAFGPCTWNNPPDKDEVEMFFKVLLTKGVTDYIYQWEMGEQGTLHIQFGVYFENKRTKDSVIKMFPGCHIEVAQNWPAVKNYCSKKDTRVDGPYKPLTRTAKDPLRGLQLFPWQEEVLTIISSEPDSRTIHWFVDDTGNTGKTSLAKHICLSTEGTLFLAGKAADMKYGCCSYIDQAKNPPLRVVIVDLVRTQETFFSYQGLEEIKNGIFFNTKYESKMVIYDCPHVIVFANWMPQVEKLSKDRWSIHSILERNKPTVRLDV